MKTRIVIVTAVLAIAACTQPTSANRANLIGTHDLVLVDEVQGSLLAGRAADGTLVGIPSRFLFVTSADTNEVRMLENYRPGFSGRGFVRAPNPLETLSIPVLDRPTMLAADEGRNGDGARVTGSYVYVARPGGAEVSVVSVSKRRQLGGRPMVTPGPVTAIGAYLAVTPGPSVIETAVPDTTRLFVATWDGEFAAVSSAVLKTTSEEIDHLDFQRHLLIDQTPITAMLVVGPLAGRTLDGTPFCDTTVCLALSTRSGAGLGGATILIDPQTGRSAPLAFVGPVRDLVSSSGGARIYGILDEQSCGSISCGGVVAVDVVTGTSTAGFPGALDALGLPMRPLRADEGLITGLTLAAAGAEIRQTVEAQSTDGGTTTVEYNYQQYAELGAFASSTGVITWFSGLAGSIIDFDPRRSVIASASVRLPGLLADGGTSFVAEDGGALGSNVAATVDGGPVDLSLTYRTAEVITAEGAVWNFDLSDGYLQTQSIAFVYQGQIPGLVALPTTAADGVRLATNGLETRAAVGDLVRFETFDGTSYLDCGRSTVAAIGAGFVDAAEAPAGCEGRVRFSVRAAGLKPIVVAADVEGYLGRYAAGETLTYSRPYVFLTAGVVSSRPALTVNIPPMIPTQEGAFTSFEVQGRMAAFQASLDATSLSCYSLLPGQVVMGNMVMEHVPSSVSGSSAADFRWTLFGVVPSGNALAEINLAGTRLGALGTNEGAFCHR